MKAVFIILSIAMMCQVSLGGVLGRFKRESTADGFEALLKFVNDVAEATGPLVKSVIAEIPKTDNYDKYRQELEEFLEAYSVYETKKGICIKKSVDLLEKFSAIVEEYEKEDAPVEAKKIDEIFNSFDSEDLEKEIMELEKKIEAVKDSEDADEEVEGAKVVAMMLHVC